MLGILSLSLSSWLIPQICKERIIILHTYKIFNDLYMWHGVSYDMNNDVYILFPGF